eukprot:6107249-Amphidinium_carterae.1
MSMIKIIDSAIRISTVGSKRKLQQQQQEREASASKLKRENGVYINPEITSKIQRKICQKQTNVCVEYCSLAYSPNL